MLAPTPAHDNRPLPAVLPVTKRAELAMGRAHAVAMGSIAADVTPRPAPNFGSALEAQELPVSEVYLMAADCSTGQPPPPPASLGQGEPARADRPARVAIGLSRA